MNNGGTPNGKIIVGLYVDPPAPGGINRGYVVENGKFAPYDVPGSVQGRAAAQNFVTPTVTPGINASADFVGLYDDVGQ